MAQSVFSIDIDTLSQDETGYFNIGVPCPIGRWPATSSFGVSQVSGFTIESFCKVIQLWPDGSIKWLRCKGLITKNGSAIDDVSSLLLCLIEETNNTVIKLESPVKESDTSITASLNNGESIVIDKYSPLQFNICNSINTALKSEGNSISTYTVNEFSYELHHCSGNYVALTIFQKFVVVFNDNKYVECAIEATLFLSDGALKGTVTFTNPKAALHPNGQWDLGDPNSVDINELCLSIKTHTNDNYFSIGELSFTAKRGEKLSLYQASSGFDSWNSPVHVNKNNCVTLPFKGFRVHADEELVFEGNQASPTINLNENEFTHNLNIEEFWQNFPSSVVMTDSCVDISLLGSRFAEPQEIQPGEQKTRSFSLSQRNLKMLVSLPNKDWLQQSGCLPFFPDAPLPMQNLIEQGINGESSFFEKRKQIDQFGWRHFGELYADHEKALSPNDDYFISHYNNQYDPIVGMLYQWMLTGNSKWFELADTLAKHVADIDVYHTKMDKPEYSGGLFWHTDHYVQACTATHRTYSKLQPTGVYDDHAGGGGPGGQHCYTGGLTLHYLLTGYTPSKEAALSICNWIKQYYEGDGTLLGAILAFKNSEIPGLKNVKSGQYPLDRGTGNYIQALLDRFELTGRLSDMELAANIIAHTISADDDLEQKNLSDVESTWFYTVFLQAVCRFIALKEQLGLIDDAYHNTALALKHYASWMIDNEYAYLDKPDILEFPNQTWSAQDLRKLCILYFASNYLETSKAMAAIQKAQDLESTIYKRLSDSDESSSTRVLCLMMQNANYHRYQHVPAPQMSEKEGLKTNHKKSSSAVGFLLQHIANFSFSRERKQFVKRFPQFQKWLGQP